MRSELVSEGQADEECHRGGRRFAQLQPVQSLPHRDRERGSKKIFEKPDMPLGSQGDACLGWGLGLLSQQGQEEARCPGMAVGSCQVDSTMVSVP